MSDGYEFKCDDLDMGQVERGSIAHYVWHRANDLSDWPALADAIFSSIGITLTDYEREAAAKALEAEWSQRDFLGNYRWYVAVAMRAVRDASPPDKKAETI